ncbi:MAG: glycoside hydrolase family 43 protein [Hyphomicrobiales bacterium]
MIKNPILPGFNPDPSICRVGDDYYIATSTFEWYPGVQIHHSRDLVNWTLVARPLNRKAQLDMRGNPDSCGIWAPCLSHSDGKFWLVYTDVKRLSGAFKDAHNYIVTCETIDGDWSDPVYANSSGFDPSLFHDDDGRKWFINLQWNHRGNGTGGNPAHASFDGTLLQEYDHQAGKLVGPIKNISDGSPHGLSEGPHLFKRNGYYYLTLAEGGTGYKHAVSMARSKQIEGPYELHPNYFLMTAKDDPDHPIQRTGHGQMVETPDGRVYHTFLMGRPMKSLAGEGPFCPMGRETGIAKCIWRDDDWLYLEDGGLLVPQEVPGLVEGVEPTPPQATDDSFTGTELPMDFQWLRTPEPDRIFAMTGNALRLYGRESIGSAFEQALVARRQEHFVYAAETALDFDPETYQQAAGLTTYYNCHKFHFLALSHDPNLGRSLALMSCLGDWPNGAMKQHLSVPVAVVKGPVEMRVEIDHAHQQFFWKQKNRGWQKIGPELDASLISDEAGRGEHANFTGAFVGMVAFDTSGRAKPVDFYGFSYQPEAD